MVFVKRCAMIKQANVKSVKICYTHIGGKLGTLLFEQFITKGWIKKANGEDKHFSITEKGQKEFTKPGLDLSQIKSEKGVI